MVKHLVKTGDPYLSSLSILNRQFKLIFEALELSNAVQCRMCVRKSDEKIINLPGGKIQPRFNMVGLNLDFEDAICFISPLPTGSFRKSMDGPQRQSNESIFTLKCKLFHISFPS